MEDRKRYLKLLENSSVYSFSDFTGIWKKLKINALDSISENSWYNIKSGEIFNQGECVLLDIEVGPGRKLTSYQILNHAKDFLDQLEPEKYYAIICQQEVIPFRNNSKQCKIVPAGYGSKIDLERVICPEVYFGQKEDDIRKEIIITNNGGGRLIIKTFIRDMLIGIYEYKEFEIVEINEEEYNKELWRLWKPLKLNPNNIA